MFFFEVSRIQKHRHRIKLAGYTGIRHLLTVRIYIITAVLLHTGE